MQCTWNAGACIIITSMGKKFHFSIRTIVLLRVSHFSDIKIQPEYVLAGLHLEIDPRRGAKYVFVKKEGGGGGRSSVYICTSTCTLGGSVGKF